MSTIDDRNVDAMETMLSVADNVLGIEKWGFKESYRSARSGKLIYNSEWCRISIIWGGWDPIDGNSINFRYGRLHAPDESATMICNGQNSRCWHRFEHALHFLDGRTPTEAAKLDYSHFLIEPFYEDEVRKKFARRQPEWLGQIHLAIWQHYANRFFELFDLRRPDLWQQYQQFLKEVYDITGRSPAIKPPLDKVC
jgi:hypothetical protein